MNELSLKGKNTQWSLAFGTIEQHVFTRGADEWDLIGGKVAFAGKYFQIWLDLSWGGESCFWFPRLCSSICVFYASANVCLLPGWVCQVLFFQCYHLQSLLFLERDERKSLIRLLLIHASIILVETLTHPLERAHFIANFSISCQCFNSCNHQ